MACWSDWATTVEERRSTARLKLILPGSPLRNFFKSINFLISNFFKIILNFFKEMTPIWVLSCFLNSRVNGFRNYLCSFNSDNRILLTNSSVSVSVSNLARRDPALSLGNKQFRTSAML